MSNKTILRFIVFILILFPAISNAAKSLNLELNITPMKVDSGSHSELGTSITLTVANPILQPDWHDVSFEFFCQTPDNKIISRKAKRVEILNGSSLGHTPAYLKRPKPAVVNFDPIFPACRPIKVTIKADVGEAVYESTMENNKLRWHRTDKTPVQEPNTPKGLPNGARLVSDDCSPDYGKYKVVKWEQNGDKVLTFLDANGKELSSLSSPAKPRVPSIETIQRTLESGNINDQNDLLESILHYEYRDATPLIVKMLKNGDARVVKMAAKTLGDLKDNRAIPELIKILNSHDEEVRDAAAEALGIFGDKSAIKPLRRALKRVSAIPGANRNYINEAIERLDCHAAKVRPSFVQDYGSEYGN